MSEAVAAPGRADRWAKPLFLLTILTGSFLLFLTQPMVARMALPRLGGTPAVWNSAMLVYQALLLAGYAYAHWAARFTPKRQAWQHLALLAIAALWLPIGLTSAVPPSGGSPAFWVPWFLLSSIGPLFFIVSAQAPLMQRWYALETSRGEPYALYAASNLGSFAGLISYPLLVEPLMGLKEQSLLWSAGYLLLVALVVACAIPTSRKPLRAEHHEVTPKPTLRRTFLWILLAAIPSGLMLSTTTHLTTDIVAMPLLWVLPLGLYLLSFVVAFATRRGVATFITQLAPLVILIAGGLAFADGSRTPLFSATLGLSLLFVIAVALHGEMYRLRPAPDHLTAFYLAMAVGGLIGGAFCAIIAPELFDWTYEHPLLIAAAALLLPQSPLIGFLHRFWSDGTRTLVAGAVIALVILFLSAIADGHIWWQRPEWVRIGCISVIGVLALLSLGRPIVFTTCLIGLMLSYEGWTTLETSTTGMRTRSYFGVYTVTDRPYEGTRTLVHGTTLHGLQSQRPGQEREPTSYYGRSSGVGHAVAGAPLIFGDQARIGVVGLGTGTLACYARPRQSWRFFEIDPTVVRIATDPSRFSFLSRCNPRASIILGDARLTIAQQPAQSLDLLAIDAFSSDAVPMHLMTREAMEVYGRALQPDGLILFHISNRYLDLRPVLAANAKALGWEGMILVDQVGEENPLNYTSIWVAMSRDSGTLLLLQIASGKAGRDWLTLDELKGFEGWTDDHASIMPLLKDMLPWE